MVPPSESLRRVYNESCSNVQFGQVGVDVAAGQDSGNIGGPEGLSLLGDMIRDHVVGDEGDDLRDGKVIRPEIRLKFGNPLEKVGMGMPVVIVGRSPFRQENLILGHKMLVEMPGEIVENQIDIGLGLFGDQCPDKVIAEREQLAMLAVDGFMADGELGMPNYAKGLNVVLGLQMIQIGRVTSANPN